MVDFDDKTSMVRFHGLFKYQTTEIYKNTCDDGEKLNNMWTKYLHISSMDYMVIICAQEYAIYDYMNETLFYYSFMEMTKITITL